MRLPIFYSALMLTAVNLILRLVGTSFQVYLSGQIGAAGVGLLQLVLSVGNLALVAGIAGIRTAAMYLTAGELGRKRPENVVWVLSGCFAYSLVCSGTVGAALYTFAPQISDRGIGNGATADALRLFAVFLPVICFNGVMSGYFTAANRIGVLAAVEVGEQLISMAATMGALTLWAGADVARSCQCVILGSVTGSAFSLVCLLVLRLLEHAPTGAPVRMGRSIRTTALPLALGDILKSGINTTESLMVPKRLSGNADIADPLAAFGMVSGMVFPVLMFPACILFGLAELLLPELARCAAAGSSKRIRYLVRRGLRIALLYGLLFGGLEFLLAETLCIRLYDSTQSGSYLKIYALLIPMLYCDAITDAMTKGLGQQKACVRYNILSSALDVIFLWFLLPKYGMDGYFVSFALTHLLNFLLSLRRLLKITGQRLPFREPAMAVAAAIAAALGAMQFSFPGFRFIAFLLLLGSLLCLLGVTGREDLAWVRGLLGKK